jgi:hypothetical protein
LRSTGEKEPSKKTCLPSAVRQGQVKRRKGPSKKTKVKKIKGMGFLMLFCTGDGFLIEKLFLRIMDY